MVHDVSLLDSVARCARASDSLAESTNADGRDALLIVLVGFFVPLGGAFLAALANQSKPALAAWEGP
jgi:hypothetical protein